jgi:hypothetical protein
MNKGIYMKRTKPPVQRLDKKTLEVLEEYESFAEAARATAKLITEPRSIYRMSEFISRLCRDNDLVSTAYGFKWRRKPEEETQ